MYKKVFCFKKGQTEGLVRYSRAAPICTEQKQLVNYLGKRCDITPLWPIPVVDPLSLTARHVHRIASYFKGYFTLYYGRLQ